MMKQGLLLINLGTPDAPDSKAVRRYLREFLTDKRVIDLPVLPRYLLVYGAILPFRPQQTAKNYQAIWTENGSPLLTHSVNLKNKLQTRLGSQWKVALGMRYGNPSLSQALNELNDCKQLTILPLYPQYSSAASGSSIEKILQLIGDRAALPSLKLIRDFHQHSGFIEAQSALIQPHLAEHDYVLFSYHGVPERHLKRTGCISVCKQNCTINDTTHACYKAQCYVTTNEVAKKLNLKQTQYGLSFQSRLGRTPWIRPYTDEVLPELAKKGIKNLAVACPSFVADCLETLEEIGMRAKEQWQQLGGQQFTLIPCVNDSDLWVDGLVHLINDF